MTLIKSHSFPTRRSSDLAGEQAYGRIDGKHLHRYVEEQAAISRRYLDQGHPKFWGRIIGTSADTESAEWLANKFKAVDRKSKRLNSSHRCISYAVLRLKK